MIGDDEMATIDQDIAQIRQAIYGKDVREAIADGIEQCYADSNGALEQARTVTSRNATVFSDETEPIDSMSKYVESVKNCTAVGNIGDNCYSDSFWGTSSYRLSLYKALIHFNKDTVVFSDSSEYVFKFAKASSSGVLAEWPSAWYSEYVTRSDEYYVFTMKRADGGEIQDKDYSHIMGRGISYDVSAYNNYLTSLEPSLKFITRFIYSGITGSSDGTKMQFSYTNGGYRRSCLFTIDKPILLSMRNPDYCFRFYWIEAPNVWHETGWGTLWETPTNTEVGISIKRRDSVAFSENERPEIYLETWNPDSKPKPYYLNEINDTIEKVNQKFTEPGLCFLLSTDHHTMPVLGLNTTYKYDTVSDMVVNMKAVAEHIKVDANIALGDIADFKVGTEAAFAVYGIKDLSYQNLDSVFYKWMKDAMQKLKSVHPNFYYVMGNHDDNRYINRDKVQAAESSYDYTPGEVFGNYISKGNHDVVYNDNNNGLDYYVDFANFKIRSFFIDANYYNESSQTSTYQYTKAWWYGFSNETVSWMQQQLSSVPNGWSVIVFSHMSPIKEHNEQQAINYYNFDNMKNVIQAFISGGGNYIATFYGHTHGDWSTTTPWLDICLAAQKCQNYDDVLPNMPGILWPLKTEGTYTEDCWNVVLILPKSRKIKIIRFGAGDDREFTY